MARTHEPHDRASLLDLVRSGARASLVGLLPLALPITAQTIVNGDMDGVADFTTFNAVTPPGWTGAVFGGTDLWNPTTTAGGTTWAPSVGGGPFVHGAGVQTGVEWVEQSVIGLTVGASYDVYFEQSISAALVGSGDVAGFWRVSFGPDTLDSPVMNVPALGVAEPWQLQVLSFTASAPTQVLRFTAFNVTPAPPMLRAECGLDTVRIEPGCTVLAPGFESVRLGVPPNPFALIPSTTGPPVVGTVWDPYIDHTSFVPTAVLDVFAFSAFPANLPSPPLGTILCSPPFDWQFRAPTDSLDLLVPDVCTLVEQRLCVQGASVAPSGAISLTNALDITIGSF